MTIVSNEVFIREILKNFCTALSIQKMLSIIKTLTKIDEIMSIDPFSDLVIEKTDSEDQRLAPKTGLIAFFLCSFDVTRGLQILFSSPKKFQNNQDELNILKTHCIWKIENIPLRIDLKFSEFIYSAFQIHDTIDAKVAATIEKPLYGIVIKIWKDNRPIPVKTLLKFKSRIENEVGKKLNTLSKRKQLESNPIKQRKYKNLSEETKLIQNYLENIWNEFKELIANLEEISVNNEITSEINENALSSVDITQLAKAYIKEKISLRTITTEENPDQILVILINQGENLTDVTIHVSKTMELFSETIWVQKLPDWPMKEEIILEFPKSNVNEIYLIKVSSRKMTIDIKSVEVGAQV
jgi:hypothetical protein